MVERTKFYIGGAWVEPKEGRTIPVVNPATEETLYNVAVGGAADVDAAVSAARAAWPAFAATTRDERVALLGRILELYAKRMKDIGAAVSDEMGAPLTLAERAHAGSGLSHFMTTQEALKTYVFEERIGAAMVVREPIGVAGQITPWNWPMNQIACKVAPALAAGCTMVLKPSEYTPTSALILAEVLHEAGVPPGVFNLVNGLGPEVGAAMSGHPGLDMISFTGSTRAGIAVAKSASESIKRVALELGGKSPNIVFADSDLPDAIARGLAHCFENTGQSCNAPTRMLVERPFYREAVEIAREVAENTRVAPASEAGDHIGPVVNERQWKQIQRYIQAGIDEGARLVAGGTGLPEGRNGGFFVKPTVFADVTPGMTIEREEIFGPVLAMTPFDSEDEAVRIANDTPYGLTNYVQSPDPERRHRLALALRSGMVEMNGRSRAAGSPFGGVKASGRAREGGVWGIEEFLEAKAISGW